MSSPINGGRSSPAPGRSSPINGGRSSPTSPSPDKQKAIAAVLDVLEPLNRARTCNLDGTDASYEPFNNYPDFSVLNNGRHDAGRSDTFRTPSRLGKRGPGIDKKGLNDAKDFFEICEQGLNRSMHNLGQEILANVRESLIDVMRDEMRQALTSLADTFHHHNEEARQVDVDFSPIREEMRDTMTRMAEQQELTRCQDAKVMESVAQVREDISTVQRGQSKLETVLTLVYDQTHKSPQESAQRAEVQLKQISQTLDAIQSDSANCVNEVKLLKEDNDRQHADVPRRVNAQLSKTFREQTDNTAQILKELSHSRQVVHVDLAEVLAELSKIQQGLNLEFTHFLDNIHEEMEHIKEPTMTDQQSLPRGVTAPNLSCVEHKVHPVGSISSLDSIGEKPEGRSKKSNSLGGSKNQPPAGSHAAARIEGAHAHRLKKRVREQLCQTDAPNAVERFAQTDDFLMVGKKADQGRKSKMKQRKTGMKSGVTQKLLQVDDHLNKRAVFADAESMKQKVREANMRPQYNVCDFYFTEGVAQHIARHFVFEHMTHLVILLNALWIAVDTDHNDAAVLVDAKPVFQVVENLFCCYFVFELITRFLAFEIKRHCLQDGWFVFDTLLVGLMVVETWLISIIIIASGTSGASANVGDVSILRMVRMVKMLRISRMARVLRAIPELVVLMKGILIAARSVGVFFLLWLIIIYVFAVVFCQLTTGSELGNEYFHTVPAAMNTLLLDGLLPDSSHLVNSMADSNPILWPIIMAFILLASLTLMYMLIGVLVEVIGVIAVTEKEVMTVSTVASELRYTLEHLGTDTEKPFHKTEFQKLLTMPAVIFILQNIGVDVIVLLDMSDMVYDDIDKTGLGMSFNDFVNVILNMRGSNQATVKDVKQQLRFVKALVRDSLSILGANINEEFQKIHEVLQELAMRIVVEDSSSSAGDTVTESLRDEELSPETPAQLVQLLGSVPSELRELN